MKAIRYITAALLFAGITLSTQAQVVRKSKNEDKAQESQAQVTERMQSLFDEKPSSDANIQWQRIVYRSLDLNKEENMPLYYPEEPGADGMNLFYIIIKHLSDNTLAAYEYLDGREMFTDEYRVKLDEMFDRFYINYTYSKGSSTKAPKYVVEDADVPANEVLSYYIIEKYEFDRTKGKVTRKVDAICPVLHREGDFGGDAVKYPMFWVKMSDLRPYISQQYVFTDNDNNLLQTSLDDFFLGNMYKGELYKYKNMRNLSMIQMYPDSAQLKHAQDSIEKRLVSMDANMWVPTREELKTRREAQDSINAAKAGKEVVKKESKPAKESSATRSTRSTKPATSSAPKAKSNATKSTKSSAPKTTSSSAVRSVRQRK